MATALALLAATAQARQTFLIPPSDGYGIGECFAEGHDCARVVADAWCEAHGNGRALAYGRTEDATGSIAERGPAAVELAAASAEALPGSIIISCGD